MHNCEWIYDIDSSGRGENIKKFSYVFHVLRWSNGYFTIILETRAHRWTWLSERSKSSLANARTHSHTWNWKNFFFFHFGSPYDSLLWSLMDFRRCFFFFNFLFLYCQVFSHKCTFMAFFRSTIAFRHTRLRCWQKKHSMSRGIEFHFFRFSLEKLCNNEKCMCIWASCARVHCTSDERQLAGTTIIIMMFVVPLLIFKSQH